MTTAAARVWRPQARRGVGRKRSSGALAFYGFISPWLIGTVLLALFPLGYALYISFTNWDGLTQAKPWAGLANYREVFSSPDTWSSLYRTALLIIFVVPATIIGSLVLALFLNERVRGRVVFRTLIYIPAIIPPVASALIWKDIFATNTGAANRFLALFGINAVSWLIGSHAFQAVVVMMLWALAAGIIIDLAVLQTVDVEQLQAAKIDGANMFLSFRHVTLPAISPVLLVQTVVVLIATVQTFVPAILLSPASAQNATQGGTIGLVPKSNTFYMLNVYQQFFAYSRYGFGSAMIIVFFLFILLLTGVVFKVFGRNVYYAVDPTENNRKARRR